MANTALMLGPAVTILQNVSYALPARLCFITSSAAIETSLDEAVWTPLANANTTGALTGAVFVRCPGGSAIVVCKDGTIVLSGGGGGGGVTPSGNLDELFRGDATFSKTYPSGTITTSKPWTFSQIWNAVGVVFAGLRILITGQANAADLSSYLKVENSTGEIFGINKDNATTGNHNQVAVIVNASQSAVSADFAIRVPTAGIIALTTAGGVAARTMYIRNVLFSSNVTVTPLVAIGTDNGLKLCQQYLVAWTSSTTDAQAGNDAGLARAAAGVIEANLGAVGVFGTFKSKTMWHVATTFAGLPAAPIEGMVCAITDGSVNTWGTIVAGGGANHVLVYYNGTNWTVCGK